MEAESLRTEPRMSKLHKIWDSFNLQSSKVQGNKMSQPIFLLIIKTGGASLEMEHSKWKKHKNYIVGKAWLEWGLHPGPAIFN